MSEIRLDNTLACVQELQTVSNGLATLDHWWNASVNLLSDAEETWAAYEAKGLKATRTNLRSGATATEVKAALHEWTLNNADARAAWDRLREARKYKEKVERYYKTAEKRLGAAQAARNGHEVLARAGGNT